MKVHWTDNAISQLIGIYDYIARDSSFYAQRMVDRLTRCSQQISDFPRSGRMVPEYEIPDIREVIEKPYRLIYRVKADQIDVIAVVHGARLLPSEPSEL
ncbi:MAG TPA: type II toxin-antitoxin system RelE/ParE family toxin [Thermoanaerobaculia bacterium]